MKLHFPHCVLSIEDVLSGKINQKKFTPSESYVLNFIKQWYSEKATFKFQSSGSTGIPKKIHLTRQQLSYSATATLKFLYERLSTGQMLLCINPEFIGGTQVIVRSLISGADLHVVPSSSDPLTSINVPISLASMVPIQILSELNSENPFSFIETILIGGAELNSSIENQLLKYPDTRFFHTYGMTETASHIALRKIGTSHFKPVGDVELALDFRDCLRVRGSVTSGEWIQTNDVVALSEDGFLWIGRADWVINSGGIKIHPEQVEAKISLRFPDANPVITSFSDSVLGHRVILLTKYPILNVLKQENLLTKYEMPKEEFIVKEIPLNSAGKLDRRAISERRDIF